jgi:glycyl-tRNA synthetase (class II)
MYDKMSAKQDLQKLFSNAVLTGNKEELAKLFEAEPTPDINADIVTAPAIFIAAQQQDWDLLDQLYQLGAQLNVKNAVHSWYLIHECIKHAPEYVVNALIADEEVNLNVRSRLGKTPTMVAIECKKFDIVDKLIESGKLEWSQRDNENKNLAHYAADLNDAELLIKLAKMGVPLGVKDKNGKTALDYIGDEIMKKEIIVQTNFVQEESENEVVLKSNLTLDIPAVTEKAEKVEEVVKKVSGLSSIKRK